MGFEGLSKKEAALIWMLQTGLDINDTAKINSIYSKIKEKSMFSSDFAKLYEEELTRLKDGSALNHDCISCGNALSDGEFAICESCMKKIAVFAKEGVGSESANTETASSHAESEHISEEIISAEPVSEEFAHEEIMSDSSQEESISEENESESLLEEPESIDITNENIIDANIEELVPESSSEKPVTADEPKQKTISIAYEGGKEKFKEKYILKERSKEREKANSDRISKTLQQKKFTKLLIIISAVLFVCVVVLSIAFLRMSLKTSSALNDILQNMPQNASDLSSAPQESSDIDPMLEIFEAYAKIQGYTVMPAQQAEEGSIIYEIIPSNDYLIMFYDDNNNKTGVALQMNDDSEDAQVEQLTLMAFLLSAVYDDLSLSDAGEFLEQDIVGGDMAVRGNYSWNLAKIENNVVLMGIDIRYMDEN